MHTREIGEMLTRKENYDLAIEVYKEARKIQDFDMARRALQIAKENEGEGFELSNKIQKTRHHAIFNAIKTAASVAVIATSIALTSPGRVDAQAMTYPDTSRTWGGFVVESPDSNVTSIKSSWVIERAHESVDSLASKQRVRVINNKIQVTDESVGYTDLTQWIGIGGANPHGSLVFSGTKDKAGALGLKADAGRRADTTLIQIGTESENAYGDTHYSGWVETLPNVYHKVMTVNAGDTINASISLVEGTRDVWEVRLEDKTSGVRYMERIKYASSRRSAEFITEIPLSALTAATKPKGNFKLGFGWHYTGAQENRVTIDSVEGKIGDFKCRPVVLQTLQTHGKYPTFTPGKLEADGSFEITYEAEPK